MGIERLGLSDDDLLVLGDALDQQPDCLERELDCRPWSLLDVLEDPAVTVRVLEPEAPLEGTSVSSYLFFAALVQRAAADLRTTDVVNDWTGPGQRLPVFDVEPLREFIEAPGRVVFLASLLAGFANSSSLPVPVNRLDLEAVANWIDVAVPADRVLLLRHLGDLALFRSGVMADDIGAESFDPVAAERLGRSLELRPERVLELIGLGSASPGIDAMESLGPEWYRAAREADADGSVSCVVSDIATRFRPARRFLNHLADRYLHPFEPSIGISLA